jgi:hypothetical protein
MRKTHRNGENSVDLWTNTEKDGSGTNYMPTVDSDGKLNTANFILDEYGNQNQTLGDNCFKGVPISIASEHHEIHCGDSYTAHHTADLTNAASLLYIITTPDWGNPVVGNDEFGNQAVKVAHLAFEVTGESETIVEFFEAPTVSVAGSAVAVLKRNRNSAKEDYLTITQGATTTDNGTELDKAQFGSGRGVGGNVGRSEEWILKNNTKYLLRVTNNTANNNYHTVRFQYYVHAGI